MKYKHHTLLPAHAFQRRGSVVGGRSLRLHGGDGWPDSTDWGALAAAEEAAYNDLMQRQHAEWLAQQGYARALEEYNAQKAYEEQALREQAAAAQREAERVAGNAYLAEQARLEAERLNQEAARVAAANAQREADYQARLATERAAEQQRQQAAQAEQQRLAQITANYKPFDINRYGFTDDSQSYYMAADRANQLIAGGRPDLAQQFIDQANEYVAQQDRAAAEQQRLMQQYGTIPYGTGMGPALGYAYGMKNAEGDIFRKFDAQGNLTEFMDQHGQWQPASVFKPVGFEVDEDTGQYRTRYLTPAGVERSNFEPNRYRDQQGGWLGEGGWRNLGMLALTGLTAGLAGAGVGAGLAGGVAGANAAESAAALTALLEGGSTLGNALQIGNQLVNIGTTAYDFLKDSNPQTAQIIEQLQTETAKNESAGMTRDQAVEAAMNTIAATTPPPPAPVIDTTPPPPPTPTYVPPTYTPSPVAPSTPAPVIPQLQNTPAPDIINTITEQATKNQESGMTREEAVNAAITGVSARMGVTEQNILDAIGVSKGTLSSQIADLGTGFGKQLSGVETRLQDQIAKNEAAGMSRDQALDAAIRSVSTQMGMTERNLLDSIQGTKTELGREIQGVRTELAGVESSLLNQIYKNELAGMTRDQALQTAITGVSTQLGLTEQNLLNQLGITKNELSNKITDVETNLGGQITDVGGKVTDLTQDFTEFSDWTREQEENRRRKQEGEEAVNLLSQMASGSVKSGIPAKIDYMYDISGESIFATPKQESLMPSPFEEAPEPVEGAMPNYQYYDPTGGYLYAGGGMVAFEDGGEVTPEELEAASRPATYNPKLAEYGQKRKQGRETKQLSEDELLLAEIAAGFHPVIGPALSAKDFEEARQEDNYLGMGLAALGMIPVVGGAARGYSKFVKPALQRRAADAELVRNYGKIPEGKPIPEGYFGGPEVKSTPATLPSAESQAGYYASPKFQTEYAREFTHDLVHGSPSPDIVAFNPRAAGSPAELARESSMYSNPLLRAPRESEDITTFLSRNPSYSDQYLPTVPSNAPIGYGFPIPKKEYQEGATMYPVSARLGKVFDPDAKDAAKVTEDFLSTFQRPKDMSAKEFERSLGDIEKLLKKGDPKVIESPEFAGFLKDRGYDSFAFVKKGNGQEVKNYGVFDPARIRSKFAEFNPEFASSPEIMKADGGYIDDYTIEDLYRMLGSK